MEKKHMKLWEKILIIVLIVITVFVIFVAGKLAIITNLSNAAKEFTDKTNYLAVVESLQCGSINIMKSYNKDGNYLSTMRAFGKDIPEERAITIYHKNNESMGIIQAGEEKIAILDGPVLGGEVQVVNILSMINDSIQKIQLATMAKITTERYNSIECYLIELPNWKLWVDKETGLVLREINCDMVSDRFYEFDVVTDEDISKPDISDCKIAENN